MAKTSPATPPRDPTGRVQKQQSCCCIDVFHVLVPHPKESKKSWVNPFHQTANTVRISMHSSCKKVHPAFAIAMVAQFCKALSRLCISWELGHFPACWALPHTKHKFSLIIFIRNKIIYVYLSSYPPSELFVPGLWKCRSHYCKDGTFHGKYELLLLESKYLFN